MRAYLAELREGLRILCSRDFWIAFRAYWTTDLADRVHTWALSLHQPEDMDGEAWCLRCFERYPCAEVIAIDRRHRNANT